MYKRQQYYNALDPTDLAAIVAYVRSLPPLEGEHPASVIDFPVNFLVKNYPRPYEGRAKPAASDTVNYGSYLAVVGGCFECHTPQDARGAKVAGFDYAGGRQFPLGETGGVVRR